MKPILHVLARNPIEFSKYRSKYPKAYKALHISHESDLSGLDSYSAVVAVGDFHLSPNFLGIFDAIIAQRLTVKRLQV